MYFHMNKHHKKVMKSQKYVHSKDHTAKISYDLYKGTPQNARNHEIDKP